jgi:hypothetical protein
MIHDATVEVTCDKEDCDNFVIIEPDYKHTNYSGGGGHYDCSDAAIGEKLTKLGWILSYDESEQYCDECS